MRKQTERNDCTAMIGSITGAMRAQKLLAEENIRAKVIKMDSANAGQGCAYGLRYDCMQESNLQSVLQKAGIRVREYGKGDRS